MTYIKPEDVKSPQSRWSLGKVLHDAGEGQWSAAEGEWEDEGWGDVLVLRWNGKPDAKIGNPQSSGHPTWFVVPHEFKDAFLEVIKSKQPKN